MSLYYKCKMGYYQYKSSYIPSNISEITWLDESLISIPIFQEDDKSIIIDGPTTSIDYYNHIRNIIGNQVDSLYLMPSQKGNGSSADAAITALYDALPSLETNAPNTAKAYIESSYTSFWWCTYIPGFKMLLRTSFNGNGRGRFFVDENGNINNELYTNGPFWEYSAQRVNGLNPGNSVAFYGLTEYSTPEDLKDGTKYIYVNILRYGTTTGDSNIIVVNGLPQNKIDSFWGNITPNPPDEYIPDDPLEPIGPSGPGGGGGNFDQNSDIIADSSLPTISAADTGFTRIYSPTLSQVQDLAQYLWTDETVVETIWNKIKQLLENPMDAIISFSLVPVPVQISGTKNFALAYIDTGVQMNTVANQFVDVDCGTFELKEYYGSALDYSPNTKVSCFLPFIGVVTLNTDEVMNTTLNVKYRVDIVSGSCVAKVFINDSCLYQFSGHCSIPIPISAADFSSYLAAAIGVAKLAIGAAAGGGAGAAAAGASEVDVSQATSGAVDSRNTSEQSILEYAFSNDPANGAESVTQPTKASFDGISAKNITNVVGTVMGSKLHVEHSGSFSGNTGYLGIRRPYLIIQRPRMCMPNEYRAFNGYPSMITLNIGDCKGYTKVQQVQLNNIPATNPEQSEIMQLLKGGVII